MGRHPATSLQIASRHQQRRAERTVTILEPGEGKARPPDLLDNVVEDDRDR
jgi:hypothetical protein